MKTRLPPSVPRLGLTLVTVMSLLAVGCTSIEDCSLTYRVWNGEMGHRWVSAPAPDPQLALFEASAKSDVLVQYNSLSDKSGNVKRQAYLLQESQPRIINGRKPLYVDPALANDMKPIPISPAEATGPMVATPATTASNAPSAELHAVLMADNQHFKLFLDADRVETYQLPIYVESSGRAMQIIATPFAVAGDTLMVAGIIAMVAALAWLESGAPH
jgi:hypothetical protein